MTDPLSIRDIGKTERNLVKQAAKELRQSGKYLRTSMRLRRTFLKPRRALESDFVGWGWKEPNTHLYIDQISEYFPNLKYIHLMRHGLDMSFSANQQQLHNWGGLYGIDPPSDNRELPQAALRYWIEANRVAIQKAQERLGDRFLLIRFEDLCHHPQAHIEKLHAFLDLDVDPEKVETLSTIPQIPSSYQRYKQMDQSQFRPEQIEAVRDLGFSVD